MPAYEPLAWARQHAIAPGRTAEALLELLLENDLGAGARALVLRAGREGKPDGLRTALQLVLHCPEFQLG
jgi:hypothetical protein